MAVSSSGARTTSGARWLRIGDHGIAPVEYDGSHLVTCWHSFLTAPDGYPRHLRWR